LGLNLTGGSNSAFGYRALYYNSQGNNNIAFGNDAGFNITTGNNNIIIGNNVHAPVATGDNQVNIANIIFVSGSALGQGTQISVNSYVGIGVNNPQYKLQVSGSIAPTGDGKHKLGSVSNRFSDIYALQTTIGGIFEANLKTENLNNLPTGTILIWSKNGCTPCEIDEDKMVIGVVKNGKDEPIILGAEPILVTGKVEIGDFIVTSNKKGHGKAISYDNINKIDIYGKVIAQALESGNGESFK